MGSGIDRPAFAGGRRADNLADPYGYLGEGRERTGSCSAAAHAFSYRNAECARHPDQLGMATESITKDKTLSLDLEGHAGGTYRWTVYIVQGERDGQLQILDRFLSARARSSSSTGRS
jgi:hypothetical protein